MLAKVSGREVPIATKVMAVTPGLRPITQPITPAISPTAAVRAPMKHMAAMKHGIPPPQCGGGVHANKSFHPIEKKCKTASIAVISSIIPSSFFLG